MRIRHGPLTRPSNAGGRCKFLNVQALRTANSSYACPSGEAGMSRAAASASASAREEQIRFCAGAPSLEDEKWD